MSIEDNRHRGQYELSAYITDQATRERIRKNARRRHRDYYWDNHTKEDYECPACGRDESEVDRFEVHHKDRNALNGSPDNLIAFCRRCHHLIHDYTPPESLDDWKTKFANVGELS